MKGYPDGSMPGDALPAPDPLLDPEADLPRMTLVEHLDELRRRLMWSVGAFFICMVVAFVYWKPIWRFVRQPYDEAARLQGVVDPKLMAVDPGEGFFSILKLSFLVGVVVASPVILWQMWGFVAAGLYKHERRLVRIFFPVSLGLFALGMILAYVILIPFGLSFLLNWNIAEMGVASDFRIQSYISICLTMVFGMAVLFELPLVMLFLQATGIVERKTFVKGWRFAVLLAFVVGMFLTDPSPVTQILMAIPVVGLYFLGIWGGRFVGEDREQFRWYRSWPIVLGLAAIVLLIVYADQINAWSAKIFGGDAPVEAPASPGGEAVPGPQ
ncbi:MAG: twin-arginine translocase subunit TatC [Planctomycetota bacterium]|jgi:sec-independent protein translocase protein TatC